MKTFLVAVDFSPVTDDVVDAAVAFAHAFKGKVLLLHVIPPPIITPDEQAMLEDAPARNISGNDETGRLLAFKRLFEKSGIDCRTALKTGTPSTLILEEIKSAKADYVIMGSHGHGRIYDLLVGGTAGGVIKRAVCCVILVPPEDRAYQ